MEMFVKFRWSGKGPDPGKLGDIPAVEKAESLGTGEYIAKIDVDVQNKDEMQKVMQEIAESALKLDYVMTVLPQVSHANGRGPALGYPQPG